ncbi:protein lin-37 homolog [Anopheles nili]|uniref:protein lin-37 homolog n=1 Tax=Anopheles nili TaxID=185578 RepID=UPI00237B3D93|nr:protein lin-37 homolog [Anopheles nili]
MLAKRRTLINSDEKRKALQNVAIARGRLKGALKTINPSTDESSNFDDSDEDTQIKRQRTEETSSVHHPYIISLFNRGIDIARFREDSPIYPLCRAWVKNEPHANGETKLVELKSSTAIKREYNPDIVEQYLNGEITEITEMPQPQPPGNMEPYLIEDSQPVDDFDINESSLDKDDLMREHLVKWKKVRKAFISHRQQYEETRYGTSFKLLDALKK